MNSNLRSAAAYMKMNHVLEITLTFLLSYCLEISRLSIVQIVDNQQNMMIAILVQYGGPDWGAQKTYESRVTPNRSVKFHIATVALRKVWHPSHSN